MATNCFCDNCGAELPPDAKFCGKCGKKVEEEALAVDEPVESKKKRTSKRPSRSAHSTKPPKQFESLMRCMWQSIGCSAIACVIGLFDVREYYSAGQFGLFLDGCGNVALLIWLALAILKRKSWARVTFITLTLVTLALQFKFFSTSGNGFCIWFNCCAMVIGLYCVILLLTNKIARSFVKSKDGVKRAVIFWGVFVAFYACLTFYASNYQTVHEIEYVNNCAEAAAKGSKDAYQELIGYCEGCADVSRSDIDEFVESKKNGGHDKNWRYRGPGPGAVCAAAKGGTSLLMKIKGAAKAIAVIGALLCGIGAWFKKTFIDGSGSK